MRYFNKFEDHNNYKTYEENTVTYPNVGYCKEENEIHFLHRKVLATINGAGDYEMTLCYDTSFFSKIEIDGVIYNNFENKRFEYNFNDTKLHEIKFTLKNPKEIGPMAFQTSMLKTVIIPNSVTKLCNSCFGNSYINSVTVPNSVTILEDGAFLLCSSLKTIELGENIISIGSRAIGVLGYAAKILKIHTKIPPTITSDTFYNVSVKIYVPAESLDAYKSAQYWSNYAETIYPLQEN